MTSYIRIFAYYNRKEKKKQEEVAEKVKFLWGVGRKETPEGIHLDFYEMKNTGFVHSPAGCIGNLQSVGESYFRHNKKADTQMGICFLVRRKGLEPLTY